jgi:nitrite reductase/ring-hydroxylating ferredoxin subunit
MNVLQQYWHPVIWSKDVTDKPVSVKLLDQPLVLWRVNGTVSAFYDLCLHRGAALSLGWIDGDKLVCPYHGWNYGADGACVKIPSLPFAGSAQIITNLLGGHVNLAMASDVAALPHIKAGKLHGVAVDVNSAPLPEVATFAKQGYPQVNLLAHLAFLAPQGTPDATVKTLADAIRKTLQEPKLQENLKSRGYNIDLRSGTAELNKLVKEEIEKYSRFSADELGWKAQ